MNWRRGLFRLWLALSFAWAIFAAVSWYQAVWIPSLGVNACLKARTDNPALGNVFDCFPDQNMFSDLAGANIPNLVAFMFGPPLVIFVVGAASLWIGRGFRNSN